MSNKLSFFLIVCATAAHAETLTCTPSQPVYAAPLPAHMVVGYCGLSQSVNVHSVTLTGDSRFVIQGPTHGMISGVNVAVGTEPIDGAGTYPLMVTVVYK